MTSFVILIVEVWLLTLVALGLHRISPTRGLIPLLFYVAGMVAILNFAELLALYIEPFPGIVLRTGGHVFVPIILLIVLVLYVCDGTRPAQKIMWGITGVNALVLVVLFFLLLYTNLPEENTNISGILTSQEIITWHFVRGVAASLVAFFADMQMIAIIYQGIRNLFPRVPTWIVPIIALTGALWTDSIVYNLLSRLGTADFALLLPGDVMAKTLSALVIAPPLAYYLVRIAPQLPTFAGTHKRRTLEMVYGTFGQMGRMLQQLEDELRESRATYQQLTQHIQEIFWLASNTGKGFVYLSPAFNRITGYNRETFYNTDAFARIIYPDDLAQMSGNFIRYAVINREQEFRVVCQNGDIRWLRSRTFPIYDETGDIRQLAGLAEDITEKKHIDEQEHALELARTKVRLLQDVVRDAAHDLKSPLTTIQLKADIIRRLEDPEQRAYHLNDLCSHAERLTSMIDDLFTLSLLEEATGGKFVPLDLNVLVGEVDKVARPLAEEKALKFSLHMPSQQVTIDGDITQLTRAVSNLVTNAIRYTPSGSVTITLQADDSQAEIIVQDTGIGIDPNEHSQIFSPFYRARTAKESGIEGTGLGLAISRAIVQQHGGDLTVDSQINQGTTFHITLPYGKGA